MRAWILTLLAAACGSRAEPLDKTILGEWQMWCATEDSATTCLGKDPRNERWTFRPDGTLATIEHAEFESQLDWKLERATLRLHYRNAGVEEAFRAEIVDGHLAIIDEHGLGRVFGRPDHWPTAETRIAGDHGVDGTLAGIHYTLAVPAGYRLGLDDPDRQRWEPAGTDGLTYELRVGDRMHVNGVVEPCTDPAHLSTGGSGGRRDFSVDTRLCVAGTDKDIACSAEHQRGYLEPADKPQGLAVCQTLTAKP